MAVALRYNSDLLSLFQTFYSDKKVDLVESLAWLINDEKSFGTTEEQATLILYLAHFYFDAIYTLRRVNDPDWEYLDWLTQDEYDEIMYKRSLLSFTTYFVEPTIGGGGTSMLTLYTGTINLVAGVAQSKTTTVTTAPSSILITDSSDTPLSPTIITDVNVVGGFYVFEFYSATDMPGIKIYILY